MRLAPKKRCFPRGLAIEYKILLIPPVFPLEKSLQDPLSFSAKYRWRARHNRFSPVFKKMLYTVL